MPIFNFGGVITGGFLGFLLVSLIALVAFYYAKWYVDDVVERERKFPLWLRRLGIEDVVDLFPWVMGGIVAIAVGVFLWPVLWVIGAIWAALWVIRSTRRTQKKFSSFAKWLHRHNEHKIEEYEKK